MDRHKDTLECSQCERNGSIKKEETTEDLAQVICKKCRRWIIRASVTLMLDKQQGHRWKHRAARVIYEKENKATDEARDDKEVQTDREVSKNELGKHSLRQSTAQEHKQGDGDIAERYDLDDTLERYETYFFCPHCRVSGCMIKQG